MAKKCPRCGSCNPAVLGQPCDPSTGSPHARMDDFHKSVYKLVPVLRHGSLVMVRDWLPSEVR